MFRSRRLAQYAAAVALQFALLLPVVATASEPSFSSVVVGNSHWYDLGLDASLSADCSTIGCERRMPRHGLRFGTPRGFGATLVEFKPYAMPGQTARAHHGIGIRSYQMESALNSIGIEARHCLAPVVRMHTKVSAGFDISGTLWVYLRCSFE